MSCARLYEVVYLNVKKGEGRVREGGGGRADRGRGMECRGSEGEGEKGGLCSIYLKI
jgi:hypothetical protein